MSPTALQYSILKPDALSPEVHKAATDAMRHGVGSVCVAPVWVNRVATMIRSTGVRTCAAISFPHGTSKATLKAIESTSSIKDGADEIEVVAHLPYLLAMDVDAARAELMEIVRAARSTRRDVFIKVIVESALLMQRGEDRAEAGIVVACRAVRESGCDAIATSTGFHPAGAASVAAVKLLKLHGEALLIQANVAVEDSSVTVQALLDAGADRVSLPAGSALLSNLNA